MLFTAADIPLNTVDFSRNSLRRIAERIFEGVEDTLTDVSFGHNLLGDGFNPEFSTDEFRDLGSLRHLDLSYNMLRGVAEGILEGCTQLKVRSWFFFFFSLTQNRSSSISEVKALRSSWWRVAFVEMERGSKLKARATEEDARFTPPAPLDPIWRYTTESW